MNIVLSYPKCGSDWLRYIFEYIYLQPTADEDHRPVLKLKHMLTKIGQPYNVPVDIGKEPIFIKKHYMGELGDVTNKLVFSYRDIKDVVFSFMYAQEQQKNFNKDNTMEFFVKNNYNKLDSQFILWMNNLICYYNFSGEKYIMDYQQLLSDPTIAISSLVDFFGRDNLVNSREKLLFDDLDFHTTNSINYKKHPSHMPNNSFGTKQKYEPNMLSSSEHEYIDNILTILNKDCFEFLKKLRQ